MTKINSSWKGYNERRPQLASTLFFIYPALIPVTFGHQPNVIYVRFAPWMWKASLFLNDGRRLDCRAEDLGQLTWPRGESLQVCGSHRNRTLTPEGERPWGHSWLIQSIEVCLKDYGEKFKGSIVKSIYFSGSSVWSICKFPEEDFLTLIINHFSFYKTWKPACGRDCKLTPRSFLTSFRRGIFRAVAAQNTDCISQPSLQLGVAMWSRKRMSPMVFPGTLP